MIPLLVALFCSRAILWLPPDELLQKPSSQPATSAKSEVKKFEKRWEELFAEKRFEEAKHLILDAKDYFFALPRGKKAYANLLSDIGDAYDDKRLFLDSASFLKLAAEAYGVAGDLKRQGNSLNNEAIELSYVGEFAAALAADKEALAVRRSIKSSNDIHQTMIELVEDYRNWGHFSEAKTMAKQALVFAIQIKDPEKIALSWISVGNVNSMTGAFDEALNAYRSAYVILHHLNLKDKSSESIAIGNAGSMWELLGQLHKAADSYRIGLTLDKTGKDHRAVLFNDLGTTAFRQKSYESAIFYLQMAVAIHRETGMPEQLISNLLSLGGVFRTSGKLKEAEQTFQQAEQLIAKQKFSISRGYLTANQADLCFAKHDYARAMSYADKANSLLAVYGRPQDRAECLRTKADALRSLGKEAAAIECLKTALELYEDSSNAVTDPVSLGKFLDISQRSLYSDLASILIGSPARSKHQTPSRSKQNKLRIAEALAIADRGRAQGLFRQLGATHEKLGDLLSHADSLRYVEVTKRLRAASDQLASQVSSYAPDSSEVRRSMSALDGAKSEVRQLDQALARRYPQFARIKGLFALDSQQLSLMAKANDDTLTIEYCCRDDDTLVFVVGKGIVQALRIPISSRRIQSEVEDWRSNLVRAGELAAKPRLDMLTASEQVRSRERDFSAQIYKQLMGPVLNAFSNSRTRRLVVIPDGGLLDAPFAALSLPSGKRLIEKYAITYQTSLGSTLWPRREAKGKGLLAIAYDAPSDQSKNPPTAFKESKAVATAFQPSLAAKSSDYSVDRLKRTVTAFDIVHFATHATANIENGLLSKLDLGIDSSLDARDIMGLPMKARLVVLSACSTAVGQPATSEGRLGLVWSFQAAGARSVVATNWDLNDAAAKRQMIDFYHLVRIGKPLDLALQSAAKAELLHSGRNLPYFWAAYSLTGSRTISDSSKTLR